MDSANMAGRPAGAESVRRIIRNPLGPGEMGVLLARAGVGKTALLTHIALEQLLDGKTVLHVGIDETPEKVKVWYRELIKNRAVLNKGEEASAVQHRIEPLRFIQAYLQQTFSPEKLEGSLGNLHDKVSFDPSMIVLDGLDFDQISRSTLDALSGLARRKGVPVWMSARTHRHIPITNERGIPYPCHETDDLFSSIVLLEQHQNTIRVKLLKNGGRYGQESPDVFLNAETYLLERG